MGFNNENATRIVFDVETAPLPEAAAYLPPAEAPANYKDEAKIKAYVEEATAKEVSRCALDVDLCRVVAIGWWSETESEPSMMHAGAVNEREMLMTFWALVGDRHLVGFNCVTFDLPVLLRRSLYLGVHPPNIALDRYRHPGVTDLLQLLSYNGALKLRGLSFYAKRFGFDVADDITGADIAQAVAEERWADVEHHVKADVHKTALLAAKLGCFDRVTAGAF